MVSSEQAMSVFFTKDGVANFDVNLFAALWIDIVLQSRRVIFGEIHAGPLLGDCFFMERSGAILKFMGGQFRGLSLSISTTADGIRIQ